MKPYAVTRGNRWPTETKHSYGPKVKNQRSSVAEQTPSKSHQHTPARNPQETTGRQHAGETYFTGRAVATFFILKRPRKSPGKSIGNVQSGPRGQRVAQTNQSLVRGLKK